MDVTTGDAVTPEAVEYNFPLLLDEGTIKVPSYNLETILAEKLDTILSRAENNTRMRDFYDVCYLNSIYKEQIKKDLLKEALFRTSEKRKHQNVFNNSCVILQKITDSSELKKLWENYRRRYVYARNLDYQKVISSVVELVEKIKLV